MKMSKAEKTKAFIIEKASPLFNTKGFAGTSLADMTAATGLTKGSIYANFLNKDDVALAAFDHNLGKVNRIIREEMHKSVTMHDKLMVFVRIYTDYKKFAFPAGGCPILNTATEADDTHPALRKKAAAAIISWKKTIVQLIRRGMDLREFRQDTEPETIALSMIALMEGSILISKITGNDQSRRLIMQTVEKLILGLR